MTAAAARPPSRATSKRFGQGALVTPATFVTVVIAIPALIIAATIEVYVWPHILESLSSGLRTNMLAG